MSMIKTRRTSRMSPALIAALALAAALAGCGGGGGGGTPVTPPAAAPQAALSATSLTFGSTTVGTTSTPQIVTLTNTGGAALSVSSITSGDTAFTVAAGGTCAPGGSVAVSGSCTVAITFSPTVVGAASSTLTLGQNATPNTTTLALSGTGAAAPTSTNPDLVTSVTPPTYAAGTTEKGAWDTLMAQRSACGFGLLQQDSRLDVASVAHTHFLAQNSLDLHIFLTGHYESTSGYNYFYGASPNDRATAAGFPTGVAEILDQLDYLYQAGTAVPITAGEALGAAHMRDLIETVYHARGAFWGGRSGGVGSTLATGPSGQTGVDTTKFYIVSDISNEADSLKQKLGAGNIASWPCNNLTGVGGTFKPAQEAPNPFPEITSTTVAYGTPIYFKADPGSVLVISAATVTKVSDGTMLALRQLTKVNDPASEIGDNEVFLVPTTALSAGSSYTVNAAGTLGGVAFTKSFTFATAP